MKSFASVAVLSLLLLGCIKDSPYAPYKAYTATVNDLTIGIAQDSLAANGSAKDTITLTFLKGDTQDSVPIASLNLMVTTTAGQFTENMTQSYSPTPQYQLDATGTLQLTTQVILQSSGKKDTAHLKITFAGVEVDTSIAFYAVYPSKLSLTSSTLQVSPNFTTEDTIYVQLGSSNGTPTAGAPVSLYAMDALFQDTLGVYRIMNNKSNASGQSFFIFVLGDATINGTLYTGTVNVIGQTSDNGTPVRDTLQLYSR